jgi:hypothetical protein
MAAAEAAAVIPLLGVPREQVRRREAEEVVDPMQR